MSEPDRKLSALDKAGEILGMDPLPEDAEAQIDALYKIASDEDKPFFDWIYEGLFVSYGSAAGDKAHPIRQNRKDKFIYSESDIDSLIFEPPKGEPEKPKPKPR